MHHEIKSDSKTKILFDLADELSPEEIEKFPVMPPVVHHEFAQGRIGGNQRQKRMDRRRAHAAGHRRAFA